MIAAIIVSVGMVAWLRREWRSLTAISVSGYVLMLVIAPVQDRRYVWPLFPLAGLWLVHGSAMLISLARRAIPRTRVSEPRRSHWAQPQVLAAACVATVMLLSLAWLAGSRPPRALEDNADVQSLFTYLEGMDGVDSARVVFFSPRVLTWNTRIPAMGSFTARPSEVVAELQRKRISHVVVGDLGFQQPRDRALRTAIDAYPELFSLLFTNGSFSLYSFSRTAKRREGTSQTLR